MRRKSQVAISRYWVKRRWRSWDHQQKEKNENEVKLRKKESSDEEYETGVFDTNSKDEGKNSQSFFSRKTTQKSLDTEETKTFRCLLWQWRSSSTWRKSWDIHLEQPIECWVEESHGQKNNFTERKSDLETDVFTKRCQSNTM